MRTFARIFAFLCGLYVSAAIASSQPGAVVQVATVAALQTGTFSNNTAYINLGSYVTLGDGGAGTFTPCTSGPCTVDNGVVFQDAAGNKFLRQFSGHVHMSWYGVVDATSAGCRTVANYGGAGCDSSTALTAAFAASAAYGDGWVTTDGRSIAILTGFPYVPPHQGLDCQLTQGSIVSQTSTANRVYNLSNSIILNPALAPQGVYRDTFAGFQNCNVRPSWMGAFKPSGYTGTETDYVPTNPIDMQIFSRLYVGTATSGNGSATSLSNVTALGFDTCFDQANSGTGTTATNMASDCNIPGFIWGQRGGTSFANIASAPLNAHIQENGLSITTMRWPITRLADDGTGQIKATLNNTLLATTNCPTLSNCLQTGFTVIGTNLYDPVTPSQTKGDVTNGSSTILNVPNTQGNGQDGIGSVQLGSTVSDTGTAGCNFTGVIVGAIDLDMGIITLVNATTFMPQGPVGCSPSSVLQEPLTFISSSSGSVGANSRFVIGAVTNSPATVVFNGSSYAGPTKTFVKWDSGLQALRVADVVNVFAGQFVCASGTAPCFDTAPTAFTVSHSASSDIASITNAPGAIHVTSTANWPYSGVLKVNDAGSGGCLEYLYYHLQALTTKSGYDPTRIIIQARAWDNIGPACTHVNNVAGAIVVSAPQVVFPVPNAGDTTETPVITVNAPAQSAEGTGQTVTFANDNTQTTNLFGQLILNAGYKTYTANLHASGGIWAPYRATGDVAISSAVLANVTNAWKVQPGMTVSGNNIPSTVSGTGLLGTWVANAKCMTLSGSLSGSGVYLGMHATGTQVQNDSFVMSVTGSPTSPSAVCLSHTLGTAQTAIAVTFSGVVVIGTSGATVTLNTTATGSATGEALDFAGCGYPMDGSGNPEPWLGNCPATGILLGSLTDKASQGVALQNVHVQQVGIHFQALNSPSFIFTDTQLNNGSGKGAQIDPYSTGVFIGGSVSNSDGISNVKVGGDNTSMFIDSTSQSSSMRITNSAFGDTGGIATAVIGVTDSLNLTSDSSANSGIFYYSHNVVNMNVTGYMAPLVQVFYDTSAANNPQAITCSGNNFLTTYCGDSLGLATGQPTGGEITGGVNTQTGAYKNGVEYSNVATSSFTPTGATTPTTIPNFADRALSIRDFAGVPDWSTDSTAALSAAETAALAQNVHRILLDGDSRGSGYVIGTHTVPSNIELVCPGPQPTEPTSNDFRNYPQAILLSTTAGLTFGAGSGITGCQILQKALAQAAPPTTFQDNVTRANSFTGTGVTLSGTDSFIRKSSVIGFTTGIKTLNARAADISDTLVDATQCYHIGNQGGGGPINLHNVSCSPYGTRFGTLAEPGFTVSSIQDNGSGELQVTEALSCATANCLTNAMTGWVANPSAASAQSAEGAWPIHNATATTFDLQGSTSAFITGGQAEAGVVVTSGFPILCCVATHMNQVHITQAVTGANIPAGATIQAYEPNYGIIWLDYAHAPTGSATETITIADTAPSSFSVSSATLGNSGGAGYLVGDNFSPATGTGTAAIFRVNTTDNSCGSGCGAVLTFALTDGGTYSVAPSPIVNAATTTTGAGTGLTLNLNLGPTIYGSATNRNGAAYYFNKLVDVKVTNAAELSHSIGMQFDTSANSVRVSGLSLHDENVLQDRTHYGILYTGVSNDNTVDGCGIYYFGASIAMHNQVIPAHVAPNVVSHCELGGSAGNSGLQNTLLDVASFDATTGLPTPGTAMKTSIILDGDYTNVIGTMMVTNDPDQVTITGGYYPNSSIFGQSTTADALTYLDTSVNFNGGTSPTNTPATSLTAHAGGGAAGATLMTAVSNQFNTVTTDHDSAMLLGAAQHRTQRVVNHGSHILDIYALAGASINASASPYQLYPGQSANFTVNTTGTWYGQSGLSTVNGGVCAIGTTCAVGAGPVYNVSGTLQAGYHVVQGTYTLSGGTVTITLSGSSVFTGSGTYQCFANDNGAAVVPASTQNQSATQFKVFGTGTNTGSYMCMGS